MKDLEAAAREFMGKPEKISIQRAHAQGRYEGFLAGADWHKKEEQNQAVRLSIEIAERRLKALLEKPGSLTRSELYEKEMTIDCIKRGKTILGL